MDFANQWVLTAVIFFPLVGALLLLLADSRRRGFIRGCALLWSVLTFLLAVWAVGLFHQSASSGEPDRFLLEKSIAWFSNADTAGGDISRIAADTVIDIRYHVGVDGISIWLLLLTAFLSPLAIWGSYTAVSSRVKEYYALLLVLETGMLGVFCSMDLLLFYVFFEFTLVPLFFLIGIWGGPQRERAANKFFIFTVAGSVLTFAGMLYLAYYNYAHSVATVPVFTMDIQTLTAFGQSAGLPANIQWWLFLALAAGFAIKVSAFPVHTWLPLAHTEAPTAGASSLPVSFSNWALTDSAGCRCRFCPQGVEAFAPVMAVLCICGIIYGALAADIHRHQYIDTFPNISGRHEQVETGEIAHRLGQRRRPTERDLHRNSPTLENETECKSAADRVCIRLHMAEDCHRMCGFQNLGHLSELRLAGVDVRKCGDRHSRCASVGFTNIWRRLVFVRSHSRLLVRICISGRLCILTRLGDLVVGGLGTGQQFFHMTRGVGNGIGDKRQSRCEANSGSGTDLRAQNTLGLLETCGGGFHIGCGIDLLAHDCVVHRRVVQIVGDPWCP